MQRRIFIGSSLALAAGATWFAKPSQMGEAHNDYFASLNSQLQDKNMFKPTMLIDLDRLDGNINSTQALLNKKAAHRIPVKSLPSIDLLDYIMQRSNTNRLMVFHQPFLNLIAERFPKSDVLFGKPMPVGAARTFYRTSNPAWTFDAAKQLQWLIDSQERLEQYLSLAKELNQRMRINIEIDVGLHRGGLSESKNVNPLLDMIADNAEHLEFSGFMGYDPHVVKIPDFIKSKEDAYAESQEIYRGFIETALEHRLAISADKLTLNGAGSPSLALHKDLSVCNDLTAGSCLVKPTDFDIDTLESMAPSSFISTPVLKQSAGTLLPSGEDLGGIIKAWNPNRAQTFYIYGGKWMADYVSPSGLIHNEVIGFSTNQQVVNGSILISLKPDDFVFLRPHQSEFVFLQFGSIRTVRNGQITDDSWPIFSNDIV